MADNSAMVYLINFAPEKCPGCGTDMSEQWKSSMNRADFYAGAAHNCNYCGARYQFVPTQTLIQTAKDAGGGIHE